MTSNDDIARQHFEHFHPEFAPVRRYELEDRIKMLEQLSYRFTSRKRLLERPQAMVQGIPTADDIRLANDMVIDRLKKDFDLSEASDIGDLRDAVRKLAD